MALAAAWNELTAAVGLETASSATILTFTSSGATPCEGRFPVPCGIMPFTSWQQKANRITRGLVTRVSGAIFQRFDLLLVDTKDDIGITLWSSEIVPGGCFC